MKKLKHLFLKKYMKGYKRKVLANQVIEKITINYDDYTTYEFTFTELEEFRKVME